ncbi:MAG: hypothetical protein N2747_02160 [Chitinophagaceae bacterium]|nr:hypothetical protein [Chitinophagaceae bacterium]
MLALFRQKNPTTLFPVFLLGVLIKLPLFFHPPVLLHKRTDGLFFQWLAKNLSLAGEKPSFFSAVLSFLLLFWQALLINSFIVQQKMMPRLNFLPAMAYLMITSLVPEWNYFSAAMISVFFIILTFRYLLQTNPSVFSPGKMYNMGFIMGVGSFFYSPLLLCMPWVFLSLAYLRPLRLKEWLVCLSGWLTPYYFTLVYQFVFDSWDAKKLIPPFFPGLPEIPSLLWLSGSTILILIPLLLGIYFIQEQFRKLLVQVRKSWMVMGLFLVNIIPVPFLIPGDGMNGWLLFTLPAAAFHACFYYYAPRRLALFFFWLIVAFLIYVQHFLHEGW